MTGRYWLIGAVLAAMLMAGGCESFKDANGKAVSFQAYDSVRLERVSIDPTAPQPQIRDLTEGFLQYNLLVSDLWLRGDDWNPDAFARYLEEFVTTSGTHEGEEMKPAMTQEQYDKSKAERDEKLAPHLGKAKGTRPLVLRVHITKVEFPSGVGQIVMGNKAEVRATITAFDPSSSALIGTAEIKAIQGIPGVPLLPYSMATRAALNAVFDQYTRKHVMELAQNLSREIAEKLAEAKKK
ncbi:MAG: hypothetical protein JW955_20820 [Sedimentisphaerales bacterium]|nr:hypothetical protein [Sedimentisphaerales bacterium]